MSEVLNSVFFLVLAIAVQSSRASEIDEEQEKLERDVHMVLTSAMDGDLLELSRRIDALPEDVREEFPIRIRANEVEWKFKGNHPAGALSHEMLEYIVSTKDKAYESLLVVDREQLRVAQRLGRTLHEVRTTKGELDVKIQLAWQDGGELRVARLWDILRLEPVEKRQDFIRTISANDAGLEAYNLRADPAELPAEDVEAVLLVKLRVRD